MTDIKVSQKEFVRHFEGYGLCMKDVRKDHHLGDLDGKKLDLNGDAYVTGDRELGALFDEIGRVSGARRGSSIDLVRDGKRTLAAEMVQSVAERSRDAAHLTPKHRAMRIAGFTTMGLGVASLGLISAVGLAPAALLVPIGSLLALLGGARPPRD